MLFPQREQTRLENELQAWQSITMEWPLSTIIKYTFYKQFCGVEHLSKYFTKLIQFRRKRVGVIYDCHADTYFDCSFFFLFIYFYLFLFIFIYLIIFI